MEFSATTFFVLPRALFHGPEANRIPISWSAWLNFYSFFMVAFSISVCVDHVLLQTKSLFHFLFIRFLLRVVFICTFWSRQTFMQLLPSDQKQTQRKSSSSMREREQRKMRVEQELPRQTQYYIYIDRWYFLIILKLIQFPCTLHTFGI